MLKKDMLQYYIESGTTFSQPSFWDFNALYAAIHDAIPIAWVTNDLDLNASGVEYLIFTPKDHKILATFWDPVMKSESRVTHDVFVAIIDNVKA
jgi:hypothetical protein